MSCYQWRNFLFAIAEFFELVIELIIFLIEKMTNILHHCNSIGFLFGMLSKPDKIFKQLVDIGHIKISGDDKISCHPVVLSQERMTSFNTISTVSAISQMAQPQFAGEGYILLQPLRIIYFIRMCFSNLFKF